MKAAAFEYFRAVAVDEACALLDRHGTDARIIAGGQSLVPMMAMRLIRPSVLVDIHRVDALRTRAIAADQIVIRACTRQCDIERDTEVLKRVPLLARAFPWIGHQQTRNRGTIGGSLAHADPSAELPLVAATLGARLQVRSAHDERTIDAAHFFTGPMSTAVAANECLVEVRLPVWAERAVGTAFDEVAMRKGDFALVAVAAQVALDDAGHCTRAAFGVGGAAGCPAVFPALAGRLSGSHLTDRDIDDVAGEAARALDPMTDLHATADYRRHLARGLLSRALVAARDEARAKVRR